MLVISDHGVTRIAPVRPAQDTFDLDLSRTRTGRLVAAFSRCDNDGSAGRPFNGVDNSPTAPDPTGCRIQVADIASGAERPLTRRRAGASDRFPARHDSSIAFVRSFGSSSTIVLRRAGLNRTLKLDGSRTAFFKDRRGSWKPVGLAFDGRHIVWTRRHTSRSTTMEIRVVDLRSGRSALLARTTAPANTEPTDASTDFNVLTAPSFLGGRVVYGAWGIRSKITTVNVDGSLRRDRPPSGGPGGQVISVAGARGRVVYATAVLFNSQPCGDLSRFGPQSPCAVWLTGR